jgi:transcriptional regulator with XRE-family HTH domain
VHHIENDDYVPNLSKSRQDPALTSLGKAIRRVRTEKGVSQEKLALLADLDRSYVGRVERGDNNVALLTLMKLAGALGMRVSDLLLEADL